MVFEVTTRSKENKSKITENLGYTCLGAVWGNVI